MMGNCGSPACLVFSSSRKASICRPFRSGFRSGSSLIANATGAPPALTKLASYVWGGAGGWRSKRFP